MHRSIDDLDRAIFSLAARINAAGHDLLILIRRFGERAGWLRWGFESCADWLHWRCDIFLSAAREKVRVAHRRWRRQRGYSAHTSAEGFVETDPSAEGFLATVQNRPPGASSTVVTGGGSP